MPRKQKHIVMARTTDVMQSGIESNGRKLNFKGNSVLWVNDAGEAKEIEQRYKGKVAVTLDQQYTWSANNDSGNGTRMDNTHNYTFSGVDMAGRGGGERVRVKTKDGYTFVSRAVAIEEGYKILPQKRVRRRKGAEVRDVKKT